MSTLTRWLVRICSWIIRSLEARDPLYARTRWLVAEEQGRSLEQSGEYKRHQVYARLMKDYPDRAHRDLAWAIERAIQERPR